MHDAERRLLLVHAHPDDETIGTGATMARYVADSAQVALVTCTLGEEGEVLVPDLVHLAADQDDALGEHRRKEHAAAMAELGVTDFRYLGGPGRYRDTGMATGPDGAAVPPAQIRSDSFWAADLREAADELVRVVRDVRPQVVVTYDEAGGYGHPDHIQAHRVTTYGVALAGAPSYKSDLGEPWDVPKVYWTATPRSVIERGITMMRERGSKFWGMDSADEFPNLLPDEAITARVDGSAYLGEKEAAMRAYPTQMTVDGPFFALSNDVGQLVWGMEHYRLVKGSPGPVEEGTGWEADLFAGL